MSYVPGIYQPYVMLVSNTRQRPATSGSTSMGMNSISSIGVDPLAMYTRICGSYTGQSSNKFKKNFGLVCDFSPYADHTKDHIYKLIGNLLDFK